MYQRKLSACSFLLGLALASNAYAIELGDNGEYGQIKGEFRTRYEFNDRESKPEDANASTVRLRLGYQTPTWNGFMGYVEGETIDAVGNDNFDNGMNHKSKYPAVNDPNDTALNQLYLSYVQPGVGNGAVVGRQVITFDNQRFIGRSNFRDNDTTYDAGRITLKPVPEMTLDYVYSTASHRSLGTREKLGTYSGDFNFFHGEYQFPDDIKLAAYDYDYGFERTLDTLSSNTYGARLSYLPKVEATQLTPFANVELAEQADSRDNPVNYTVPYHWLEIGGAYEGYSLSAIHEKLGGTGTAAFQTPFGTVHSFNGWVDKFTTIPNNGLDDLQAVFKAPLPAPFEGQKLSFEAQGHDYQGDAHGGHYGNEIDVGLTYTPVENNTIYLQAGKYYADSLPDNTTKIWAYYELKF